MSSASIDAAGRSTQEINAGIRELIAAGETDIEVLNPGARHNLAVGILQPARIVFRGNVGYFCGALSDGLEIEVEGDAGWSLGADQMAGNILVHGSAGASTAASARGVPERAVTCLKRRQQRDASARGDSRAPVSRTYLPSLHWEGAP